jgi:hypothetical protein
MQATKSTGKMLLVRNTEVDKFVVGGRKNDRQKLVAPH